MTFHGVVPKGKFDRNQVLLKATKETLCSNKVKRTESVTYPLIVTTRLTPHHYHFNSNSQREICYKGGNYYENKVFMKLFTHVSVRLYIVTYGKHLDIWIWLRLSLKFSFCFSLISMNNKQRFGPSYKQDLHNQQ